MESISKWKERVLNKVKMKTKHRKSNLEQQQSKPVLCGDEVKTYLVSLPGSFVIITINKAASNHACKKFYMNLLLTEVIYLVIFRIILE